MENPEPQDSPGDVDNDDIAGGQNQSNAVLEDWPPSTNPQLDPTRKDYQPTSRLLYFTVGYVEDGVNGFGRASFPGFEPPASFSPSEFEDRVSPLDPNMSSAARYSPVYTSSTTAASASYPGQLVVLQESSSPFIVTTSQGSRPFVTPSGSPLRILTSEATAGALRISTSSTGSFLGSSDSPAHPGNQTTSPQAQQFSVRVTNQESAGLLLHTEPLQAELVGPGGTEYHTLEPGTVVMSSADLKADSEQVQLLISTGDGITYSLDSQTGFISSSRVVDVGGTEFLTDRDQLSSVLGNFNAQGLVIDDGTGHAPSDLIVPDLLNSHAPELLNGDVEMAGITQDQTLADMLIGGGLEESQQDQLGLNTALRRSKRNLTDQGKEYWCERCNSPYEDACPHHRVQTICDKPVLSRAWATLPASYLAINKVGSDQFGQTVHGVFARKTIPKRTQFGPIEGVLTKVESANDGEEVTGYIRLLVEGEAGAMICLDTSNEDLSNWMRFVRQATRPKEQNLILSQQGRSLYFTSTRVIHPRQELQVGYSLPYASKWGLNVLQPIGKGSEEPDQSWPCFECNDKFYSSEELQKHLNIHDTERGDGEEKPKQKKTARSFRRKGISHFPPKKYKTSSEKRNEVYPYQCHTCHRAFPRNYSLKRHLLLHSNEKKHLCQLCGQQFSHPHNRDRHVKKHHKNQVDGSGKPCTTLFKKNHEGHYEWLCMHCHLTFDTPSVLNLHTLAHAADNLEETRELITGLPAELKDVYHNGECLAESGDIQCPQCTKEFSSPKDLIEHVSSHGKVQQLRRFRGNVNPAKPWKCELCYKSFANDDRLKRHMLVHGTEESKPLQCETCQKRFLNNSALACHIKIHTAEKKIFECPICKVVFDQVLALKDHVPVHAEENGTFTCPQCKKGFDEYSLIRKHIRAFHSERKQVCSYCGKVFPSVDKLRMHMLRHSDHREFLCANCGKQFKRKDKLKEHMKRMHSAERELRLAMKPHRPPAAKKFLPKVSQLDYNRFIYKCHTCLLGFKRRGMLVNHLAKRHPDISPDSVPELNLPILKTTRDYYCQYCDKVYKSSSKRKAHILKNHPGAELPMSNRRKGGVSDTILGLPNPTFSQTVGSVTTHPHGCPWCHKQYASKAKLLQHQRKKHIDLLPQAQQVPRVPKNPLSPDAKDDMKHQLPDPHEDELRGISNVIPGDAISILPGDYEITATSEELREYEEHGIIINTSPLKHPLKGLPDGVSAELLNQAMTLLNQSIGKFRVSGPDHSMKMVSTQEPESPPGDPLSPGPPASHLHRLLTEPYSLPPSPAPSSSPSPRTWAIAHATYTPYTAR